MCSELLDQVMYQVEADQAAAKGTFGGANMLLHDVPVGGR